MISIAARLEVNRRIEQANNISISININNNTTNETNANKAECYMTTAIVEAMVAVEEKLLLASSLSSASSSSPASFLACFEPMFASLMMDPDVPEGVRVAALETLTVLTLLLLINYHYHLHHNIIAIIRFI